MGMKDHRITRAKCPYCGYIVTAAGEAPGNNGSAPANGCFTLCMSCAGVLRFNSDMSLRKATLHEALAISPMLLERLQQIRAAILHLKGRMPGWPNVESK